MTLPTQGPGRGDDADSGKDRAEREGADPDTSAYPDDDLWRESDGDTVSPGDVVEPSQGFAFEDAEDRGRPHADEEE